jgi:hypothetical protein
LIARLRPLAGPAILGIAIWCAAGRVALTSADSASSRLVVLAPWWWLAAGVVAGLLIPRIRRDLRIVLPAIVSTIPWWPVPLPAIALVWTGPLAWLPIGLVLWAAVLGEGRRAASASAKPSPPTPRGSVVLAGVLTGIAVVIAAVIASPHVPGGDEPHYLAITQSLLRDGDLKIENNHHDPDFVAAFGDLPPHYIARGKNGAIYSIHAPGVAAIVLPGYALAGYRGAQATIVPLAAIAGALVWLAAWRATRNLSAAWFAWAAIALSATFLLQGFMVFPDGPGAFVVALAVWLVVRLADPNDRVSTGALVAASLALAALPWLHTRFSVLAAGFGAIVIWQLFTEERPERARRARLAAFMAIPVLSAIAWFSFLIVIYGTPNPTAPYGNTNGPDGTHLSYAPGGLIGLFFDEQFGLFTYAPILIVAVLGLTRVGCDRIAQVTMAAVAVATAYLFVAATYWMWWAGVPATPARLVTATLPVLAVPLARCWADARSAIRAMVGALLAVTIAISAVVIGFDRSRFGWNVRDAESAWLQWLGPVVNLRRGWPSFFWRLDPGHALSEWRFVLHAIVWAVVLIAVWMIVAMWARRSRWPQSLARVGFAWGLIVGLTTGVGAGWLVTGAGALDPATAQLAVVDDWSRGAPLAKFDAWSAHRVASLARLMRISPGEVGPEGAPGWATWTDVPAGRYGVNVSLARPRAGRLRVTVDGAIQTFDLQAMSEQTVLITVPARAGRLTVDADDGWQGPPGTIQLVPTGPR